MLRKVHTSAVVLVPPKELWTEIQAIREQHDRAYSRWMPHVNLLYPFFEEKELSEAAEKLQEVVKSIPAFPVSFKMFNSFKQKGYSTMWLQPESSVVGGLLTLQHALQTAFPHCNELSSHSSAGFVPHLSVGQFPSNEIVAGMQKFQSVWKPISFLVKEIYVISRRGEEPFEVRHCLRLGDSGHPDDGYATFVPVPLPPAPPVVPAANKIFVGNLDFSVTDVELQALFAKFAVTVTRAEVVKQKGSGKSKGFGFVDFASSEDAQRALSLDQYQHKGRALSVKPSTA